jgi:hypothetical protein
MNILAVDTGFARVKVYTGAKQAVFPSAVAQPPTIVCKDISSGGSTQYTIGGKTLVVGADALKPGVNQDYNLEVSDLIGIVPYLIAKAADVVGMNLAVVDVVVVGVPIEGFAVNKAKLINVLQNLTVNGVRYSLKIVVIPQSVGALAAYIYETATILPEEEGVLIDVGGNTVHILSYRAGEAQKEGTQQLSKIGFAEAAKKVGVVLTEKTKKHYSLPQVMEIMRSGGLVKHCGERISFADEINSILAAHFAELVRSIMPAFADIIEKKDRIVLAGGGAAFIKEHLPPEWQPMVVVMHEPEFANVRGYYRQAKLLGGV